MIQHSSRSADNNICVLEHLNLRTDRNATIGFHNAKRFVFCKFEDFFCNLVAQFACWNENKELNSVSFSDFLKRGKAKYCCLSPPCVGESDDIKSLLV